MEVIKGIPVSPGVVIAKAFILEQVREHIPFHRVSEAKVDREVTRLELALARTKTDLEDDRDKAAATLGPEPAKIFEFHIGLLQDKTLIGPIFQRVKDDRETAAYAVSQVFRELANKFRAMGSSVFRQKANDVIDLDRRVLGHLLGQTADRLTEVEEPVVVIGHEFTPAQAASMDVEHVLGFATDAGGRTGHTSIVAAALGIPVVVGCQRITALVEEGDLLIIDGGTGMVIIRPDEERIAQYRQVLKRLEESKVHLLELAELESVTKDGTHITLLGNIEFADEITLLLRQGGDGVGLFRTEFLFLTSETEPTEDEQFEVYHRCLTMLDGKKLTIRTLDLGADKQTQSQVEEPERNPFLGLRSIRYCLQNLPLFRTQLRAILRASAHGPLQVMFPLISTLMELRQAKMIVNDVMEECEDEGIKFNPDIPIGMMIEVPSAALMASVFAREAAFFSIGTNDLIQYTLAVDRGNERVANLYSGANPAVIQLVKQILRTGRRFNVPTSLCGEIAGDVTYTMLLIGLGLRTLSLVPAQIPNIKRVIRSVDIDQCERLARKVGSFDSERQVLNCLNDELRKIFPQTASGSSVG